MAQIAMLGQGGFGGVRFADMVRNRGPARYCSPNDAIRRRGGVWRPAPDSGRADANRRHAGNDAQWAEQAGMSAELRDMP